MHKYFFSTTNFVKTILLFVRFVIFVVVIIIDFSLVLNTNDTNCTNPSFQMTSFVKIILLFVRFVIFVVVIIRVVKYLN